MRAETSEPGDIPTYPRLGSQIGLVVGAGGLATVALVAVAAMLAALVFAARQSARVSTHALEPAEVPTQALAA